MYLLIAFLSKVDKIPDLIRKMKETGFTGGTVIDAVGYKTLMPISYAVPRVASIASFLESKDKHCKVLFCVIENEDEVKQLSEIIENVVGNLHSPDTGLVIAFKLDYVLGYNRWPNEDG